jgi:hypothetical protein
VSSEKRNGPQLLKVTLEIHPPMQNADNFDALWRFPVKDHMSADSVLAVAGANFVTGATTLGIGGDIGHRHRDLAKIGFRLISAPTGGRVIPDVF